MWNECGKLGEGSSTDARESLKINGFRLGEMGEKSTGALASAGGNRKKTEAAAGSVAS